jgi:hypothetical protein
MSNVPIISLIKNCFWAVTVSLLTILLLYIAKDYPCLRGAGLAMADSEAFLLIVFIAIPCFIWAVRRLILSFRKEVAEFRGARFVRYLATFSIIGIVIFLMLAVPLIFYTSRFPLRFICEQPLLQWVFAYPM